MTLAAGSRLGPYEVLAPLGAGGMGEVYRARDTKLGRDVALKILPESFAQDPERVARFRREAQTLAALNHPHIAAIHGLEESGTTPFLVLELVDGQTLAQRLERGPLALEKAVSIAWQLVDALEAAHEKGIVHRDLKPGNIALTADDRVKVLDFGLAKGVEPTVTAGASVSASPTISAPAPTGSGVLLGTAAYMSPEQAKGQAADRRSDIWAFGVVLYEMLTGGRLFAGETLSDTLAAVLKEEPDLARAPARVRRLLQACLRKDPKQRLQAIGDARLLLDEAPAAAPAKSRVPWAAAAALAIIAALALWAFWRRPVAGPIESLAVLPFVNVGADPNLDYLSDGITENLINSLAQLPKLRVVPRSTAFRYKGREVDLPKIGRELTVRAVLTGRVVQRGDTLNIQTDLVDVAADAQLWGRQYTRTLADLITVQEEIATAVSDKLRLRPTTDEQKRLTKHYTDNPEAHRLYLQGQFYWNRRTAQRLRQAADYYQQAIDKDPRYALAWAGLADCYALYGSYGVGSPREFGPRAKEAALTALRIDDTLAEAYASLGWARVYDWDWAGSQRDLRRAVELDPRSGLARQRYASSFLALGRPEDAVAEYKRAQELEPLSLIINTVVGRGFYYARQYEGAVEELRKTLELDPNFAQAHLYLGWAYEQQARYEDAIAEFQTGVTLSGGESEMEGSLGHAYAVSGKRSEAEKTVAALKERSRQRYVSPFDISVIYAGLGAESLMFEWLEKAYEDRSHWLAWIKVDPRFDRLGGDPRYRDLLRRMKLPE